MAVTDELVPWSAARPSWQRDALRRIVRHGDLSAADIDDLVELCKRAHGLGATQVVAIPLDATHVSSTTPKASSVCLTKLVHVANVNALAPNQTLEFAEHGLTIIFGNNGAGKSGYTRILKEVCRARGASETILTNVLAGGMPGKLAASIFYKSGKTEQQCNWKGLGSGPDLLSDVGVFDTRSADAYLAERTDVPFRPFGLDIFDKLASACDTVRKRIEKERKADSAAAAKLPALQQNTAVGQLLRDLSALTPIAEVEALATMSDQERSRLSVVVAELARAKAEDPNIRARRLRRRATALDALVVHTDVLEDALNNTAANHIRELASVATAATQAAESGRTLLEDEHLPGVGTTEWKSLWEAARTHSVANAYPSKPFPPEDRGARCVLCEQELSESALMRFASLDKWLRSDLERNAAIARDAARAAKDVLRDLQCRPEGVAATLAELAEDDGALASGVESFLDDVRICRQRLLDDIDDPDASIEHGCPRAALVGAAASCRERADAVEAAADPKARAALEREVAELSARASLADIKAVVLGEIERLKRLGAYELCIKDTGSHAITRKSTELTKRLVTETLAAAFESELKRLRFTHVELELRAAGGRQGALYHQLHFKRADATVTQVVSEGEARCLALAAFLAELSTTERKSAILFDDPVSSLDHVWRQCVAERLAEEATKRQVVVFSHDIVFLVALLDHAEQVGAPTKTQYLRREGHAGTAGHCSQELPWPAMQVKARVGKLRTLAIEAAKSHKVGGSAAYEPQAQRIYGLLREAWERAVEEILLNSVVERFRNSVQTQRARKLANITDDDFRRVEEAMKKCSTWLPGHDQAAAQNTPIPGPEELAEDVDALGAWVKDARGRLTT